MTSNDHIGRKLELIDVEKGDLDKTRAHQLKKQGVIWPLVHGIYVGEGHSFARVRDELGLRLTIRMFPDAVLTHKTAFYKKVVDDTVYIGGKYPYKRKISDPADAAQTLTIVQGMIKDPSTLNDRWQYEKVILTDRMGEFEVRCSTPEMILLQQNEATKKNSLKHLGATDMRKLWKLVLSRHGDSKEKAMRAIKAIAERASRKAEFDRLERDIESILNPGT